MRPVIAIVGSADSTRTYQPPVRDPETACVAAKEIGRELAAGGYRILVHSDRPHYIEHAVVQGFVESNQAESECVQVRGRFGVEGGFDEFRRYASKFLFVPESARDWEVAFYRSLLSVDGVLLIGGGRSTFIAGVIALARRIPLAPVASFGGAAERVWHRLHGEHAYATEDDIVAFAQPWESATAAAVVAALTAQCDRRQADEAQRQADEASARRRTTGGLVFALVLLLLALGTIPLTYALSSGTWQNLSVLVAAALLASTWGAVIRNAHDGGGQWLRAAALGSAAGAIAFLLFVAAQMSTNPDLFGGDGARRLVFFVLAIGFIGGFTFEVVYRKLRDQDVAQTSVLPPNQ